jgi:class 3 adenylate cyclase/tetratricopeptide (TPR) repeat protein
VTAVASLPSGTVTFLFTDIEGSTRVLDRLGAAGYSEVLAAHDSLLRRVFKRHGGREVDTQGDAFFVAFARAGDAVHAAVDAQRALYEHAWPDRVEVRVRIGLHTGEPALGADRYVGMGVHRAARISAVGHGGQILVSSATRELIADDLPAGALLVDLGEYQLKDLDRAERVYQLLVDGLPAQFSPLKAPGVGAASLFVGRERELTELTAALEPALAGSGRVVLVAGEAGIGKSRLADEFAATARGRGARVLWGRCWDSGGAPAYWPWVQSLRSYLRDAEPDHVRSAAGKGAADLVQILPELRELFPDLDEPEPSNPEGARFRLFDSTVSFLRAAAGSRPLVLTLDDLHAADTPSLLLLEFVAREGGDAPLLIVGLYRDVELHRDHPLRATLGELARIPSTVVLEVGGLTEQGAAELVSATAGREVHRAVAAAIQGETEGNPLFVAEMIRLLAAENKLDDVGSAGRGMALPASVREVIGHRLDRLSRECAELLAVVSVLGREFSLDAVERLGEGPAESLLDLLDEAMAARVIAEARGSLGRFRFAHALVRDALYEELTPLRRIRLHRRAGEALESLYAHEPHEHLAELAYHFFEAAPGGDARKAIDYLLRAGDGAVAITAYEEAARLYGMGLTVSELGSAGDQMLRCRLSLRQGEAHARAGDSRAAKEAFLRAAGIARQLGSAEALGEAALGYGGRFVWEVARGDPHLVPLLEEALAAVPEQHAALRARLLARLAGGPLRDEVDRGRRDALSREAVELARAWAIPRRSPMCSTGGTRPSGGRRISSSAS